MKEIKSRVSVRKGFSDRNNIKPLNRNMQFDNFDDRTRNVFSVFTTKIVEDLEQIYGYSDRATLAKEFAIRIFDESLSLGEHYNLESVSNTIKSVMLTGDYDEILTVIEVMCQFCETVHNEVNEDRNYHGIYDDFYLNPNPYVRQEPTWFDLANSMFEDEFVGYRFIGEEIQCITSQEEISSIEAAYHTKYEKVNIHITKALNLMKVTGTKDYKNVIKECSNALECLLNIELNESGLTLGKAVNKYASLVKLHPAFKQSISSFYGFTSDSAGIRHDSNKMDFEEGFDEAKLVLVQTSAFINYIVSKENNE